jgi:hypothetical protein
MSLGFARDFSQAKPFQGHAGGALGRALGRWSEQEREVTGVDRCDALIRLHVVWCDLAVIVRGYDVIDHHLDVPNKFGQLAVRHHT